MAVLQKMRTGTAGIIISAIIALSLLAFVVDRDTISYLWNKVQGWFGDESGMYETEAGRIDGEVVSRMDFDELADNILVYAGGSSADEEQKSRVRQMVWNSYIYNNLYAEKVEGAGFTLSPSESNTMFVNSYGNQALANLNTNQYLLSKYANGLVMSELMTPERLAQAVSEANTTTAFKYVRVPYPFEFATDSTVVPSSEEIEAYYNAHKSSFRQEASREVEYVTFNVTPSEEDIKATEEAVEGLVEEFEAAENVKKFLKDNSDSKEIAWLSDAELEKFGTFETVSSVITEDKTFSVARVLATADVPETISLDVIAIQNDTVKIRKAQAQEIADRINAGESAVNVAAEFSASVDSVNFKESTQYVLAQYGFEGAITEKEGCATVVNKVAGVPSVSCILVVKDKQNVSAKKQVAILSKTATPSPKTYNAVATEASEFAKAAAGNLENLEAAANDSTSRKALKFSNATIYTTNYDGIESNAKDFSRKIFTADLNTVSDAEAIGNGTYVVFVVKSAKNDYYRPLSEVSTAISGMLAAKKYAKVKKADILEKIGGCSDIEAAAAALGPQYVVDEDEQAYTSINMDPALIGAISGAPEGKIGVVAASSEACAYVYVVTGRTQQNTNSEADVKQNIKSMAASLKYMGPQHNPYTGQYIGTNAEMALQKNAEIITVWPLYY